VGGRAEANTTSPGNAWWRSFNSPELTALEDRGLGQNFDLQAAYARIEQARGSAEVAGAALYPAVNLAGTIDRGRSGGSGGNGGNGGSGGSGGSGGTKTIWSQDIFAQASYEIDFWGKNRAAAASSDALASASVFDADTVLLTLTSTVADTYFQILSLQERLRLAHIIVDGARRILNLIEEQAAAGVASNLEIAQQRNALETFEANIPVLQQQLNQSIYILAVLIGMAPEDLRIEAHDLSGINVPEVRADLPSTVLRRRPDIRAAEARLISANFDIGVARAAFYPSITLTGQLGIVNSSLANFLPAQAVWDSALSLAQPLFEGGQLEGQLYIDRAHFTELTATYRRSLLAALQDVETQLTAVYELRNLEATQQAAVDSARQAAQLAIIRFRLGTIDFLTVLTIERTLYQAEDALLQVRLQRLQAAVGLVQALGGPFDAATLDHDMPRPN
jgi:NodT family efflux transporter outer membrane factor (OMF) lipoprotein